MAIRCAVTKNECPFEGQITDVYQKVLIGDGELPLAERIRNMENQMTEALPILLQLKETSDKAEGARVGEMEFRNKRDKEIKDALALAAQHTNRWMLGIAALSFMATVFSFVHPH